MLASGEVVTVSITGGQAVAGALGLAVLFSNSGDRFGKSKIGSNQYYNKQFDAFWNQYGNKSMKTRRRFHDYVTKKGYDTWKQLLEAWLKFNSN